MTLRSLVWCGLGLGLVGCGHVPDAQQRDSGVQDDAATEVLLRIAASPSSFVLHANDTRETLITVRNDTGQPVGTPELQVVDLTLGTMMFSSNTCTTELAPGETCTAIGQLVAMTPGQVDFSVTATIGAGTVMTQLSATVMAACPATCGPMGTTNCCASSVVPGNAVGATLEGTPFFRSYDVANDTSFKSMNYPATVSDFRLDTYEVTLGRFREFVNAGMERKRTHRLPELVPTRRYRIAAGMRVGTPTSPSIVRR